MSTYTRPNGGTYLQDLADAGKIHEDAAVEVDTVLNGIIAAYNAIDNTNVSTTPKIDGNKIDLTSSGYLPLSGGDMSGVIVHNYDGVWRTMRASGNARNREYRGSDGALWGISHNTYWDSGAWQGRDVTGICAVLKMESDGLHYYHAVSGASGSTPSFTEILHASTTGIVKASIQDGAVSPSKLSYADEESSAVFSLNTERFTTLRGTQGTGDLTTNGAKLKSQTLYTGGLYSVTYEAYYGGDDGGESQIMVDGTTLGTARTLTGSYVEYTEDIFVQSGSDLEVWGLVGGGTGADDKVYVKNFTATVKFLSNTTVKDQDVT